MTHRSQPPPDHNLRFETLTPPRHEDAVKVWADSMRNNPNHVLAYGKHEHDRIAGQAHLLRAALPHMQHFDAVGAFDDDQLVGAAGMIAPDHCHPTTRQRMRLLPELAQIGPVKARRVVMWLRTWSAHHPRTPHLHIGPIGVLDSHQGRGIGSTFLRILCDRADSLGTAAYLETDEARNVGLYERFGFGVIAESSVMRAPNWFMMRPRPRDRQ